MGGGGGDKNNLESGDQMREMNICHFIPLEKVEIFARIGDAYLIACFSHSVI